MILALDIGNTNIVVGGVDSEKIHFLARLSTDTNKTADEYSILIKILLELHGISENDLEGAIISSVVPPLVGALQSAVITTTGLTPLIVGPGIKTGLNILLDNPAQLGADLVVGAVAALAKYPAPLIIWDMGTATTVSIIDKNKNFIGGIIMPGPMIANDALTAHTSQLPRISPEAPPNVIGTNTIDSMKSGLVFGNASIIDGISERIEDELGQKATIIATGGLASSIIPYCKKEINYNNSLLLEGLYIIYQKNTKK